MCPVMRPAPAPLSLPTRARAHVGVLAVAVLALAFPATAARAADPVPPPAPLEVARRENIERLGKELRRLATSPRAEKERKDIDAALDALVILRGADAAKASLEALAFDDEATERKVFDLVETVRDKGLVKPLGVLVEAKDTRRRFRLHERIAHALAAIADPAGLEPLTVLVGSEEPRVVGAAADALVAFKQAPHAKRVEPVRQLLEVYESTWNLKESRRPEDRIRRDEARDHWEIYGMRVRVALQVLTGQGHLTKAKEFRDWWNDHKKATNW
jgi:hypothetical protein